MLTIIPQDTDKLKRLLSARLMCALTALLLQTVSVRTIAGEPLRIFTELSAPAQTLENGVIGGRTTEKVRQVLDRAGLNGQFEIYPWARALDLARRTPNSLLYAVARTSEREPLFHWIGAVGEYRLGLLKLASNKQVHLKQLQDALPYTIAIQREDFATAYLLNLGFEEGRQLIMTADIAQSWTLLLNGKVDMIVEDPDAAQSLLPQYGLVEQDICFALMLPALAQITYLAANLDTDPDVVQRLKDALDGINRQEHLK